MAIRTPEPRLPLEPEEYPLYRPPRRFGCSALSIITLVTLFAFAFLLFRVSPAIVGGITKFDPAALLSGSSDTGTPIAADTVGGAMETQTAVSVAPEITATTAPIATPTPSRKCAKIAGTSGQGTPLYAEPKTDPRNAKKVIPAGRGGVQDGATFEITGADVKLGKDATGADILWTPVILPGDGRTGYVLAKYLQPTSCP